MRNKIVRICVRESLPKRRSYYRSIECPIEVDLLERGDGSKPSVVALTAYRRVRTVVDEVLHPD